MHATHTSPAEDRLYRRIAWRLLPVLLLAYVIAFIDRVNIGFAKLQMQGNLGFSDAVFGLGAGLMFVGYCFFEVPSNMLLVRIGIRRTLLRIMVLWGTTTVAMLFVRSPRAFYVLRFLLGVFEAGLFPGVIVYLTHWFPDYRRGRVIGLFMSGTLIGNVISGPLSGAAMKFLDGVGSLAGWQWLYITQGVPAIILGIVAYLWLTERPADAAWLSASDKAVVMAQLAGRPEADSASLADALIIVKDRRFLLLVLIDFLIVGGSYTLVFWGPTLIRSWGVTDVFVIGLLSALPGVLGVAGIVWSSRHSDMTRERRWHFAGACLLAAVGLWLTTITRGQLILSVAALCLATLGIASTVPLLITAATDYIPPRKRNIGIPLLTSLGILGGFASPAVTGLINARTGNPVCSIYLMIVLFVVAGGLILVTLPARFRAGPAACEVQG